jgi:L-amino acid N-acyltransferase YncA
MFFVHRNMILCAAEWEKGGNEMIQDPVSGKVRYHLNPVDPLDRKAIIDLFNYYIEHSFAAYPEQRVPYDFFNLIYQWNREYPSVTVKDEDRTLLGFGMLRPHNPVPVFAHTAEVSYFVHPDWTGKGLGSTMLEMLEREGKKRGVSCLLASISSRNEGSIRFHAHHGFRECGRFQGIGKKKGMVFDTIWMQKEI